MYTLEFFILSFKFCFKFNRNHFKVINKLIKYEMITKHEIFTEEMISTACIILMGEQ